MGEFEGKQFFTLAVERKRIVIGLLEWRAENTKRKLKMQTLGETFLLFKADVKRRLYLEGKVITYANAAMILLHRGVVSVFLYRLSHYFYFKNTWLAKIFLRVLRYVEYHYCRNEIEHGAEIGAGLVLSDGGGVAISDANIIGKNFTCMGRATTTLGGVEEVNVGVDKIVIGDDCVFGHNVRIISNVTIADGVQIQSNSVIMQSVLTAGAVMSGFPARKIAELPLKQVQAWSPLISQKII